MRLTAALRLGVIMKAGESDDVGGPRQTAEAGGILSRTSTVLLQCGPEGEDAETFSRVHH